MKPIIKVSFVILVLSLQACRMFTQIGSTSETLSEVTLQNPFSLQLPMQTDTKVSRIQTELEEWIKNSSPTKITWEVLQARLEPIIIELGGLPRSQLEEIIRDLLDKMNSICPNNSCAKSFIFTLDDIPTLLDQDHASILANTNWQDPSAKKQKFPLLQTYQQKPSWLDSDDFPSELTPRKNYNLMEEVRLFGACGACMMTAQLNTLQDTIQNSRIDNRFAWVVRPDGLLVIGRGPDEFMSHGVLASIDFCNPQKLPQSTRNILSGGEGWINPGTKTLYINNKSGHFRPEFKRINNPSISRLFQGVQPPGIEKFQLVDATKPR